MVSPPRSRDGLPGYLLVGHRLHRSRRPARPHPPRQGRGRGGARHRSFRGRPRRRGHL